MVGEVSEDDENDEELQEELGEDEYQIYGDEGDMAEDRYFLAEGDPTQRPIPPGEPAFLSQEDYDDMCDLPMVITSLPRF